MCPCTAEHTVTSVRSFEQPGFATIKTISQCVVNWNEWLMHHNTKGRQLKGNVKELRSHESTDNGQWWSLTRQDHRTQLATRKTDVTLFLPYAQTDCPTGHFHRVQSHPLRFRQVFGHTHPYREIHAYTSYLNWWLGKTEYILRKRTHEEREIFQTNLAQ